MPSQLIRPTDSPLFPDEEYDELCARRQDRAKRSIRRCAWLSLAGQVSAVAALVLFFVALAFAIGGDDPSNGLVLACAIGAAVVTPFLTMIPAARAAYVAVKRRAVLSRPWVVLGLAPWLVLSAEGSAVLLLWFYDDFF
jgi:hypothetical protein